MHWSKQQQKWTAGYPEVDGSGFNPSRCLLYSVCPDHWVLRPVREIPTHSGGTCGPSIWSDCGWQLSVLDRLAGEELSACLSTCPCTWLSVFLSLLSLSLSLSLSPCLCFCLSLSLCLCLSVCLSVSLSLSPSLSLLFPLLSLSLFPHSLSLSLSLSLPTLSLSLSLPLPPLCLSLSVSLSVHLSVQVMWKQNFQSVHLCLFHFHSFKIMGSECDEVYPQRQAPVYYLLYLDISTKSVQR